VLLKSLQLLEFIFEANVLKEIQNKGKNTFLKFKSYVLVQYANHLMLKV